METRANYVWVGAVTLALMALAAGLDVYKRQGLDILHPVEEGFFPAFGHDLDGARAHRLDRLLRQHGGIHIPLVLSLIHI